ARRLTSPTMPRPWKSSTMLKPARIDRSFPESPDAQRLTGAVRVWDLVVRTFHWGLVLSFGVAWLTAHSSEDVHHWAGYVAACLVFMRLMWGAIGTRYARFSQFVRSPKTVMRYLSSMASGSEARYIGHNPA